MAKTEYGAFMTMKSIKKEFDIKSTATMMRFVHREQIPYKKVSAKIILFPTDIILKKINKLKQTMCRY